MELYERIALARKQAGLSQEQLGEKLGVSRQAVSKWESGQTNPDVVYVSRMCALFGVSADWLLLGEESAAEKAPARCPGCQAIVTGLDNFCSNCGAPLKEYADTFTLVLDPSGLPGDLILDPTGTTYANARCRNEFAWGDLHALYKSGLFSPDDPLVKAYEFNTLDRLVENTPSVLGRGMSQQTVAKALEAVTTPDGFRIYRDGEMKEEDQAPEGQSLPHSSFKKTQPEPREPLSFGMMVLAVVVAILICSLL